MKRGEIYLAEIKECRSDGLMVFLKETNQTLLLSAGEIKDGIKQKHKKMIGWFIPIRIKSLRPLAISNMRLDKSKLRRMGLNDAKPILKENRSTDMIQPKETVKEAVSVEEPKQDSIKKIDVNVKSFPYGFMVWWDKCDEAAQYTVKLFIGQEKQVRRDTTKGVFKDNKSIEYQILCEVEKDRNTFYHSFINLAAIDKEGGFSGHGAYVSSTGKEYFVQVEVEDRSGNIIALTDKKKVKVQILATYGY